MKIEIIPLKGWHWRHCSICGKRYSKVEHFGGKKKLKKCGYCQSGLSVCLDCFEKAIKK